MAVRWGSDWRSPTTMSASECAPSGGRRRSGSLATSVCPGQSPVKVCNVGTGALQCCRPSPTLIIALRWARPSTRSSTGSRVGRVWVRGGGAASQSAAVGRERRATLSSRPLGLARRSIGWEWPTNGGRVPVRLLSRSAVKDWCTDEVRPRTAPSATQRGQVSVGSDPPFTYISPALVRWINRSWRQAWVSRLPARSRPTRVGASGVRLLEWLSRRRSLRAHTTSRRRQRAARAEV